MTTGSCSQMHDGGVSKRLWVMLVVTTLGLGSLMVPAPVLAQTQVLIDNGTHLCPADRPCITEIYQQGTDLIIRWDGHGDHDTYHVIMSRQGWRFGSDDLAGGSSGSFTLHLFHANTLYTFSVQWCDRHFLAPSTCSPWSDEQVRTRAALAYGPDTCKQGFVWWDAFPGDHICVTPSTRQKAADDNAAVASRRSPNGGPYGPDTCLQGYVWREAVPNDHVCVTPETREQVQEDNRLATTRRAAP